AVYDRLERFAAAHPEWPRISRLMARAETVLPESWTPEQVVGWFGADRPRTAEGAVRLIDALRQLGRDAVAAQVARDVWDRMVLSERQQNNVLAAAGGLLGPADHR